jgi:hypothetical protein
VGRREDDHVATVGLAEGGEPDGGAGHLGAEVGLGGPRVPPGRAGAVDGVPRGTRGQAERAPRLALFHQVRERMRGRVNEELRGWIELEAARTEVALLEEPLRTPAQDPLLAMTAVGSVLASVVAERVVARFGRAPALNGWARGSEGSASAVAKNKGDSDHECHCHDKRPAIGADCQEVEARPDGYQREPRLAQPVVRRPAARKAAGPTLAHAL